MAKKRILHIEDNEQNQRLVRKILTSRGYELLEAEDGREGVDMALAERPDLILMDINLPVLNGLDAIGLLKKSEIRSTPIIAVTANAMRGDRERFLAAGADDYLQKPFTSALLFEIVQRIIGGPERDESHTASPALASESPAPIPALDKSPAAELPSASVNQATSGTGMADVHDRG